MSSKYLSPRKLSREEYVNLPLEQRLVKLSGAEDTRARELHEKLLKIDLHTHGAVQFPFTILPTLPLSPPVIPESPVFLDGKIPTPLPKTLVDYLRRLRTFPLETYVKYYHIHWEGLRQAGVTAILLVVGSGPMEGAGLARCIYQLGFSFADIQKNPHGKRAYCAEDIRAARKEGKIAFMAATESNPVGNVLDRVDILYGLGIRQMGMTYEQGNYVGSGNSDPRDTGLSNVGMQIVKRMNELGMTIDLSHVGRKTAMDTIKASNDPVVLSHNGAKGVFPEGHRCRDDEMLKALAEKGGVIGISAVPNVLSNGTRQGPKDWVDHVNYCVKLIGIDHVAVGMDNDWMDHVGFHKLSGLSGGRDLPTDYLEGFENPTESWHNIIRVLVAEGYSDQEIEKITGTNTLNHIERVIG